MSRCIQISLAVLLVAGCSEPREFKPVYNVLPEFEPVVETFVREAEKRGLSYSITNLIIRYDESIELPICGQCNAVDKGNAVQKIISINPSLVCWTNNYEREALLFHELGHCFLGRQHANERLPNGDAKSLMIPDDNSLYSPCTYDLGNTSCDKVFKREYYLSELFDVTTPTPDWGK